MAGTAVRGRLTWQTATVSRITRETASAVTLRLEVPDWPGHRAGQHVDIRLTADDEPGFWENYGYHNHGDPWLEQRYQGD